MPVGYENKKVFSDLGGQNEETRKKDTWRMQYLHHYGVVARVYEVAKVLWVVARLFWGNLGWLFGPKIIQKWNYEIKDFYIILNLNV